jgi:hypothetical protein
MDERHWMRESMCVDIVVEWCGYRCDIPRSAAIFGEIGGKGRPVGGQEWTTRRLSSDSV